MPAFLKILLLEDEPDDAEMIQRLLKKEGMQFTARVAGNEQAYLQALGDFKPDIILADHTLPGFSSAEALEIMQQQLPGTVFILVTGTVSEEFAVAAIKKGADDYILKDRMSRLPLAITAALKHRQDEKEKAESLQRLAKSEENYYSALERITDAFVALDNNWCYTYMNKKAGEIFNRDPAKMIGKHIWTEFPEGIDQPFHKAYEKAMAEQKYIYLEEYYPPYDLWFENHIYPSSGGLSIYFRDITEKKKTELKLQESEKKFRTMIERITEGFASFDNDWRYTYINKKAAAMMNRLPGELIGKNLWEENPGAVGSPFHKAYLEAIAAQQYRSLEEYYPPLTGWFENHIYPSPDGLSVYVRDITGKKIQELKLNESEERYRLIYENSGEAILLTKPDGTILSANPAACKMFGRDEDEIIKLGRTVLINMKDPRLGPALEERKRTGKVRSEMTFLRKDGTIFPGEVSSTVFLSSDGEERTSMLIHDFSELKKAEQEIKEKGNFIESIIHASPDIIYIYDIEERKNVYVNEGMQRMLGYTDEEIKKMGDQVLLLLMPKEDFETYLTEHFPRYATLKDKEIVTHEFRMRHKNGNLHWLFTKESIFLRKADGSPKQIFGVTTDITEQREAEELLNASEERLRLSTELAGVAVWEYNFETNTMSRSKNHDQLYGLEWQTNWDINTFLNATHPEDRLLSNEIIQKSILQGGNDQYQFDFRVVYPDKSVHWLSVVGQVIERNGQGTGTLVRGCLIDITERKKAEEKIKESERKFRLTLDKMIEGVIIIGFDFTYLYLNDHAEKVSQYPKEELIGQKMTDKYPGVEKTEIYKALVKCLEERTPQHLETEFIFPDGTANWFLVSLQPVEEGAFILYFDITGRKKAEEKIAYQANLLANVNDAVLSADENFVLTSWNRAAEHIYGWTAEEVIGKPTTDTLQTEFLTISRAEALKQLSESGAYFSEVISKRKDGTKLFIETQANALHDAAGKTTGYVSINRDITERKKAEEDLKERKQQLRLFIENSPAALAMFDKDMNYIMASKRYKTDYRLGDQDITGKSHYEIFPEMPQRWKDIHQRCLAGAVEKREEDFFMRKDGSKDWVRWEIIPWYQLSGEVGGIILMSEVITERKQAEQALKISEEKYRTLFEEMDEGFCIIEMIYDAGGKAIDYRFLEINPAFIKQTGLTDALHKTIREVVPEYEAYWFEIYGNVARTGKPVRFENAARALGKYYEVFAFRTGEDGSSKVGVFFYDITERKYAEEQLIKSEELFSGAFHASPAGIIITRIADGKIIDANESFLKMFEFSHEEVIGHTSIELNMLSPDGRTKLIQQQIESGGLVNSELLSKTKSGRPINLLFSSKELIINDELCHITTLIDITERKKAEEEIKSNHEKLRLLAAHLQTIRDEERKRISREIHDELGQQLTAIKMDVAWIDKKIPDPSAGSGNTTTIKNKLKNINTLLDGSNQAVRKILSELRPGSLENHALMEALEWQGRQFSETTDIPVTFTASGKIIQLPEQVATCIFRVYQESLTNIMRHAGAGKVLTSLKFTDDSVVLTIKDDGKGFDIKSAAGKKSFGILGMKERVHALNGTFELVSAKGKGTKIVVSLGIRHS